jgi:Flp pilus assembly protein TadG
MNAHIAGRGHRRGAGQALAEFALVVPLFMVMMVGVFEFGRAIYYIQVVNNAAREGARYAIVHGSNAVNTGQPTVGPMLNGPSDDPTGRRVVDLVDSYATGIDPSALHVMVCWNGQPPAPAAAPCDNASGDYGPGNNDPGSTFHVQVSYTFQPVLSVLLPLPSFTLTGESTLVINN